MTLEKNIAQVLLTQLLKIQFILKHSVYVCKDVYDIKELTILNITTVDNADI